jgi:hypothetical protein
MQEVYDLIIVGGIHSFLRQDKRLLITLSKGGTSGCLVASRLENTTAKPSVLLLEAGGDNKQLLPQDPDRYRPAFNTQRFSMLISPLHKRPLVAKRCHILVADAWEAQV